MNIYSCVNGGVGSRCWVFGNTFTHSIGTTEKNIKITHKMINGLAYGGGQYNMPCMNFSSVYVFVMSYI